MSQTNKEQTSKDTGEKIKIQLQNIQNIILVLSGKGGVGKSTISSQLAWSLQYYGYDVGILDIDICGPSIPRMMGVENKQVHKSQTGWSPVHAADNLSVMSTAFLLTDKNDAIIWRGPRKNGLIKQFLTDVTWNKLDFLIIDCPPGTSDEHISISQLLSHAQNDIYVLIVTTPDEISLLDVRKVITFTNKVEFKNVLGVIENMSGYMCPCCHTKADMFKPTTGGAKAACQQLKLPYLGSIPFDQLLYQCCDKGVSFLKCSTVEQFSHGTRSALLNVIKQVTSGINVKYSQRIEEIEAINNKKTIHVVNQMNVEVKQQYEQKISVLSEQFNKEMQRVKESHIKQLSKLNTANDAMKQKINMLEDEKKEYEMTINELKNQINILKVKALDRLDVENFTQWDSNDVLNWILSIENGIFGNYKSKLKLEIMDGEITGQDLTTITIEDIKNLGVTKFGHRKLLQSNIEKLIKINNNK
eukprot:301771_1